jgi:glucokinase
MPPLSSPPIVAVDVGGTWVRAALAEADGSLGRRHRVATDASAGPAAVVAQVAAAVRAVTPFEGGGWSHVPLVAVAVPGPVDLYAGVVDGTPNLAGWAKVPLRRLLEVELRCRCLVDHDATLAALAEQRRGAGRGFSNFAYITVSTGIGAGLVLDGRLYRGGSGRAGEFGHMVVRPDGPLCGCGNRGCLEAVASGTAIAREGGHGTAEEVARAAEEGEPRAMAVLAEAARSLGLAVGALINLLDLECIALGGGVLGSGSRFWEQMVAAVAEGSFASMRADCRILRAELGEDQGLLGAVELALDELRGAGLGVRGLERGGELPSLGGQ